MHTYLSVWMQRPVIAWKIARYRSLVPYQQVMVVRNWSLNRPRQTNILCNIGNINTLEPPGNYNARGVFFSFSFFFVLEQIFIYVWGEMLMATNFKSGLKKDSSSILCNTVSCSSPMREICVLWTHLERHVGVCQVYRSNPYLPNVLVAGALLRYWQNYDSDRE